MIALATLLLATPVFGFSLQTLAPDSDAHVATIAAYTGAPDVSPAMVAALQEDSAAGESEPDSAAGEGASSAQAQERIYKQETKRRNFLAKQHRLLGLSTWAAMTVTIALGTIQYYNLYGFMADEGGNPCVQGNAIFGQGQCYGTPWPHLIAASVTTGLYATTFSLALAMPDPDDLSNAKGEFASTLRMHKLLRWVHFGGMVAQVVLGAVIANDVFGLDRANDYGTLQTLATTHLAAGLITYGAMTWAGALMTF
jgi:hypothetical protein